MPIPNDMSSESSPRDVSYADLFGSGSVQTVELSSMETSLGGGVMYTAVVVCGVEGPLLHLHFVSLLA